MATVYTFIMSSAIKNAWIVVLLWKNGNLIGVKRLLMRRTGLCAPMVSVFGGKESHYLMEVVFTTQWGYVTQLAMPHHSVTLATGATRYESALNDIY